MPNSAARAARLPRPRRGTRRTAAAARRGWRAAWHALSAIPPPLRIAAAVAAALVLLAAANLAYHVARKPTEMLFPVSGVLKKPPAETWRQYAPLFRDYATAAVSPELLAALAQVEGAGDPVARTYWRWRLTANPFAIYAPASSAVGMYQMTDAAFDEARRYCIRHHAVVAAGAWDDWRGCWLNGLYTRVLPSHAVELAAVFLDRNVAAVLARSGNPPASPQQRQELAAMIHLCGAGPATAFARRGFRLIPGERCGDHDVATYLGRIEAMKQAFLRLARGA